MNQSGEVERFWDGESFVARLWRALWVNAMRRIELTIDAVNQSESVKAFKAIRTLVPNVEMGPTLAKLRANAEVLTIETDCPEWEQRLEGLCRLVTELDENGIRYSMKMVELFPVPIDHSPPPIPNARTITRSNVEATLEFERSIEVAGLPQRVLVLIQQIQSADWFVNAGRMLDDVNVLQGTVEDAQNEKPLFQDASLECNNLLRSTLCYRFHYHYNRCWNAVVYLLKPVLDELMAEKLKGTRVPMSEHLQTSLCGTIRSACIEHFFAPQVMVSIHSLWVKWLLRGHIPYGWDGDLVSGRLIVV